MTVSVPAGAYAHSLGEGQFQEKVIALARARGWHVQHTLPARVSDGAWATPIQGDAGFPDLVLARRGRVCFVELKAETGRLSSGQRGWLSQLTGTAQELWVQKHVTVDSESVLVAVWRPSDWPRIEVVLR